MHGGPAYRGGRDSTPGVAQPSGGEVVRRPRNSADMLCGEAGRRWRTERTEKKNGEKRGRGRRPVAFFVAARWREWRGKRGQGGPGVRRRVEEKMGKREGVQVWRGTGAGGEAVARQGRAAGASSGAVARQGRAARRGDPARA
jgi:hypothetical protein